jgi:hypothetical protein
MFEVVISVLVCKDWKNHEKILVRISVGRPIILYFTMQNIQRHHYTNVLGFGINISFHFKTVSQLFQRTSLLFLVLPSLHIQGVRAIFHLG